MDNVSLIAVVSIVTAGFTTGIGCMVPALSEGKSVATVYISEKLTTQFRGKLTT
jgi:F-type H+-transporting ATPase subunit c